MGRATNTAFRCQIRDGLEFAQIGAPEHHEVDPIANLVRPRRPTGSRPGNQSLLSLELPQIRAFRLTPNPGVNAASTLNARSASPPRMPPFGGYPPRAPWRGRDACRRPNPGLAAAPPWGTRPACYISTVGPLTRIAAALDAIEVQILRRLSPPPKCGARCRSRGGLPCGQPVARRPGGCGAAARCRWHGGASTGPRTAEGRARSLAALARGRAARWARWREARAAGASPGAAPPA